MKIGFISLTSIQIIPYVISFLSAFFFDNDFTFYFIFLNILIILIYFIGIFVGYNSSSFNVNSTQEMTSYNISRRITALFLILYSLNIMYVSYLIGNTYGWLNFGAYRVYLYDFRDGFINIFHSTLFLIILSRMFILIYSKENRDAFFIAIFLSFIGIFDGAKASVLFPITYFLFAYLYCARPKIRFFRLLVLFTLGMYLIVNLFDFEDIGAFKLFQFYYINGTFNFFNVLNGDYLPISYHLERLSNFIFDLDNQLFVYDKNLIEAFGMSSNTASSPATYYTYFGISGLFVLYFIVGFFIAKLVNENVGTLSSVILFSTISSAILFSFFEEYLINNILLYLKLFFIISIFRLFDKFSLYFLSRRNF